MITWENYEEYIMMHADGELQPAEEQELVAFLNTHPELKSEMALYEATRLSPDETLVYNDKNSLLKPELSKHTISLPNWQRYAIAAGIAALLFIPLFKYWDASRNIPGIVKKDTANQVLPAPKINAPINIAPAPQQSIAATHTEKPVQAIHHEHIAIAHIRKVNNKQPEVVATVNNNAPAIQPDHINALVVTNIKTLPGNNTTSRQLTPLAVPPFEVSVSKEVNKRSFIDRLPIDEANKRQLKTISHITHNISKVKDELEGNEITFNIKNNNIHISF